MSTRYVREVELYADARGRSRVADELKRIGRSDARGIRAIRNKIGLLRQQSLEDALRSRLIKKPSATIYVLRVQSGPVSYRLPFFEPSCRGGAIVVLTSAVQRRDLRGGSYAELLEDAERLRADWIERNCKGG
ncbi:MAG TPA: hypothetical protein VFQ76_16765 [Longimicrobiaceae bacterium]|nr:hypothetical protein [Longimicrobiaceae bacterium]